MNSQGQPGPRSWWKRSGLHPWETSMTSVSACLRVSPPVHSQHGLGQVILPLSAWFPALAHRLMWELAITHPQFSGQCLAHTDYICVCSHDSIVDHWMVLSREGTRGFCFRKITPMIWRVRGIKVERLREGCCGSPGERWCQQVAEGSAMERTDILRDQRNRISKTGRLISSGSDRLGGVLFRWLVSF